MLGDAVEVTDDYGIWWSYIPHFIQVPGYVYAYSFGYLFSLAIYRRYLEEGDSLVEPYFDLLRAGGSAPPAELASRLGFDIGEPSGRLGLKTRVAVRDFQAKSGLVPDGFATATILARLRGR